MGIEDFLSSLKFNLEGDRLHFAVFSNKGRFKPDSKELLEMQARYLVQGMSEVAILLEEKYNLGPVAFSLTKFMFEMPPIPPIKENFDSEATEGGTVSIGLKEVTLEGIFIYCSWFDKAQTFRFDDIKIPGNLKDTHHIRGYSIPTGTSLESPDKRGVIFFISQDSLE